MPLSAYWDRKKTLAAGHLDEECASLCIGYTSVKNYILIPRIYIKARIMCFVPQSQDWEVEKGGFLRPAEQLV